MPEEYGSSLANQKQSAKVDVAHARTHILCLYRAAKPLLTLYNQQACKVKSAKQKT
jgi:hypothetical protein